MLENTLHAAEANAATLLRSLTPQRSNAKTTTAAMPAGQITATPKSSDELRAQLDALRLRYSDDHPDVRRLQASLEMALRREKTAEVPRASTKPRAGRS